MAPGRPGGAELPSLCVGRAALPPIRPFLLDSPRSDVMDADKLRGNVCAMASSTEGCRALEHVVRHACHDVRTVVFSEVVEHARFIMSDPWCVEAAGGAVVVPCGATAH